MFGDHFGTSVARRLRSMIRQILPFRLTRLKMAILLQWLPRIENISGRRLGAEFCQSYANRIATTCSARTAKAFSLWKPRSARHWYFLVRLGTQVSP